jgi:hypothetical protein
MEPANDNAAASDQRDYEARPAQPIYTGRLRAKAEEIMRAEKS